MIKKEDVNDVAISTIKGAVLKLDYVITSDIAYMRFHGRNAKKL